MVLAGLVIAVGVVVDDAIIDVGDVMHQLRRAPRSGWDPLDGVDRPRGVPGGAGARSSTRRSSSSRPAIPVFFLTRPHGVLLPAPGALLHPRRRGHPCSSPVTVTPGHGPDSPAQGEARTRKPPPLGAGGARPGTPACCGPPCAGRAAAYVAVVAIVAAGIAVMPKLGQDLLPTFRERDFLMHWVLETERLLRRDDDGVTRAADRELREVPGVRNFGAHVGQAAMGDEVVRHLLRRELDQHRPGRGLRQDTQQ